ncbi:hypothetical protein AYO48_00685 [Gaiella sp. SCGC AG-212-M14]|nr:hypothetical protein AYO48_00685 [Gaiella sp. SCGC AG-212-M14]
MRTLPARRWSGRVANHETRREFDVQHLETLPFELSHQQTHNGAAHLCKWLANSGEGRRDDRRVFDVPFSSEPNACQSGLTLTSTRCGRAVGHDGDFPGYRSIVLATPNGRREAVVMINVDESRVPWSRLEAAAGIALCSG